MIYFIHGCPMSVGLQSPSTPPPPAIPKPK